ncbi:cation diffusion facilitator family transporter [Capnocytophaga canis]|uniref:cation diffusion facilitator family transporter n=1 Tax=Capnocytophaga canis TaxID=1848903 RepID=UPI00058994AB|nr:cation diffusion facilitator family transporter [Capnocytophaga canis]GIM61290.1 cation efflux system protein [Capnocytophaga canis]CEN46499.1 Cadmium, cobalt and zinc/H(+)-K(+) antiporter [Capnocytophaga canis]
MEHSHEGHSHSVASLESINRAFYIGIGLNLVYTIIEFVVGFRINSLALISDASHNLSDVASLVISLLGLKLTQKAATYSFTYGYKKASILASFINAVLLVYIAVKIILEAIERFDAPPEMAGSMIIITATIGVIINALSAFLFYKGQKQDINVKGAFLHLLVDALVSVGVIVSGVIIHFTGWYTADVLTSLVVAVVILVSTWNLLTESVKLILDGVPQSIKVDKIRQIMESHPKVCSVHHIHIWALSSQENALTAHLVIEDSSTFEEIDQLKKEIRHTLQHEHIQHTTFEVELSKMKCKCDDCH